MTESVVEEAALNWLEELGYEVLYGPDIAPEMPGQERESFGDVLLLGRLRTALERINPDLPASAIDEAVRQVRLADSPSLHENNRRFHRLLVEGVPVSFREGDTTRHVAVRLVDFDRPDNNDWLAVNQLTVIENKHNRRPDIVLFINGLPLAVIELKNPAVESATIKGAFNQLQTYKDEVPSLFVYNEALVVSDGTEARVGSLTADWDRFMPWRTIDGRTIAPIGFPELEVIIKGVFGKERFLDLIRFFTTYHVDGATIAKKVAAYHQYHAANKAVDCTVAATSPDGDKRVGVVWHTQGSGKSLSMAYYAGKVIQRSEMENPTLIVLTDRNDLDDQLFDTFASSEDILRQKPVQAGSRAELRELLQVASGGVVFTTVQKFFPEDPTRSHPLLSERRNIVFIADEAHRSQYGFIRGFARHVRDALPNASFIGFTGTPIESDDRSTPAVFGNYIDVYDIGRAVEDGATVRIYYESRLARIELDEAERPRIDADFEEVTEGEEQERKEKVKTRWARMAAVVGTEKRLGLVAKDIVEHFENRLSAMHGKGMIVCMSRRICVDLYNAVVDLRPEWQDEDDSRGMLKVVMTGSASDPPGWQQHIRNKARRKALANRFRDPNDPFQLVLVRDMWLTGFDAPSLHTMYVDKPMRGHGLMQAIARVNRVFRDKEGGLVVDYLGVADQLKKALSAYTEGDRDNTGIPQEEAVAVLLEKHEVVCDMLHGFDWSGYMEGSPEERLHVIPEAMEHVLQQEDGKQRFMDAVTALSKAFALSVPHEDALAIRDDVGFFQTVRAALAKCTVTDRKTDEELDTAVRQIVSKAVAPTGVVDIFAESGLGRPDISILSDEFLAEVRGLPQKNLAVEVLRKLLNDEIAVRSRKSLVQSRSFAEMLEQAIRAYQNRTLEAAEVILQLIELAKAMREAGKRGEKLGLTDDELAFYDALEVNDSAVAVLGDATLRAIAQELVDRVRQSVTIDWTVKQSVRAKMRAMVKRILRKYGYPPDKQEKATRTVLEQAELLCADWAA